MAARGKVKDGLVPGELFFLGRTSAETKQTGIKNAVTLSSLSAQDAASQINLRHALGQPNVIRPTPGDLVLLCTQRVSERFELY